MARWTLDGTHSDVGFAVRHMMVSTVRGRFEDVDAVIEIDEQHPEQSYVEATVQAASLTTHEENRDQHLRSADFFDVEQFPTITFRSSRVEPADGDRFRVVGDLTIRDVTREVALEGRFAGPIPGMDGKRRVGFEVTGEINREDFGLNWNAALETGGVLVGKTVKLDIDAQVVEAAEAEAAA